MTTTEAGEVLEKRVAAWLEDHASETRDMDAAICIVISGEGGGAWTLDGSEDPPSFRPGASPQAKTTVELSTAVFQKLLAKETSPEHAFLNGEIKILGDFQLALWLGAILG